MIIQHDLNGEQGRLMDWYVDSEALKIFSKLLIGTLTKNPPCRNSSHISVRGAAKGLRIFSERDELASVTLGWFEYSNR